MTSTLAGTTLILAPLQPSGAPEGTMQWPLGVMLPHSSIPLDAPQPAGEHTSLHRAVMKELLWPELPHGLKLVSDGAFGDHHQQMR